MINPIQSNVSFAGVKQMEGTDKFTGAMPAVKDVRSGYRNAVESVKSTQKAISDSLGKNFDRIA